jgi:hypothetical protein
LIVRAAAADWTIELGHFTYLTSHIPIANEAFKCWLRFKPALPILAILPLALLVYLWSVDAVQPDLNRL